MQQAAGFHEWSGCVEGLSVGSRRGFRNSLGTSLGYSVITAFLALQRVHAVRSNTANSASPVMRKGPSPLHRFLVAEWLE